MTCIAAMSPTEQPKRLAIIVSHPIQYYAPLYQRLARRQDLVIKVFFGWHAGQVEIEDRGFARKLKWDIDTKLQQKFARDTR